MADHTDYEPDDLAEAEAWWTEHEQHCLPGEACVECGGCDCGVDERTCTAQGPGCYSYAARDQWRYEMGYARG